MKFEHFGINVPDPRSMASWYIKHFNLKAVRVFKEPTYTHFLADESGRVFMEIYANKDAPMPEYIKHHPLEFHIAFEVEDPQKLSDKLIQDGALFFEELKLADGSHIIMLRDPGVYPFKYAEELCQ